MNPSAISRFNARAAAEAQQIHAAVLIFDRAKAHELDVAFGEISNDAQLHQTGQGMQHNRVGILYFPSSAPFVPGPGDTFTVKVADQQPAIVGKRYSIAGDSRSAPGHPTLKFTCIRLR